MPAPGSMPSQATLPGLGDGRRWPSVSARIRRHAGLEQPASGPRDLVEILATYTFHVERSVTRITAESIAGMAASLRLAETRSEITATALSFIASRNEDKRVQEQKKLD